MRGLILLRHAKAEAGAGGAGDRERALSATGAAEAETIGRRLAAAGFAPDLALVSSARRARQTWSRASEAFGAVREEVTDALYEAAPAEIAAVVSRARSRCDLAVVVGHNPGLHAYAVDLLTRGGAGAGVIARIAMGLATATAVAFSLDDANRAAFDGLFDPRAPEGRA